MSHIISWSSSTDTNLTCVMEQVGGDVVITLESREGTVEFYDFEMVEFINWIKEELGV